MTNFVDVIDHHSESHSPGSSFSVSALFISCHNLTWRIQIERNDRNQVKKLGREIKSDLSDIAKLRAGLRVKTMLSFC